MSVFSNTSQDSAEDRAKYAPAVLGLLGSREPIDVLRETPEAARRSIAGLDADQVRMPEAPGKWSIAHVLRHLADSEVVWGWRMRLILAQDRPTITGYDQDQWADRLHYADADAGESLDTMRVLRRDNLRLIERGVAGRSAARRRPFGTWRRGGRGHGASLRRSRLAAPRPDRSHQACDPLNRVRRRRPGGESVRLAAGDAQLGSDHDAHRRPGGALVFGYMTQRIGLSPIVGYLIAGIAVGPHTPGFVGDLDWRTARRNWRHPADVRRGSAFSPRRAAGGAPRGRARRDLSAAGDRVGAWLATGLEQAAARVRHRLGGGEYGRPGARLTDNNSLLDRGHVAVGWLVVEDIFTVLAIVMLPALFDPAQAAAGLDGAGADRAEGRPARLYRDCRRAGHPVAARQGSENPIA